MGSIKSIVKHCGRAKTSLTMPTDFHFKICVWSWWLLQLDKTFPITISAKLIWNPITYWQVSAWTFCVYRSKCAFNLCIIPCNSCKALGSYILYRKNINFCDFELFQNHSMHDHVICLTRFSRSSFILYTWLLCVTLPFGLSTLTLYMTHRLHALNIFADLI